MSDSSASSSDDDSLLASPVFTKKRDRRTERAEKNKLDFFDTCLRGSDARTDVHRRIAEVDNEFMENVDEEEEGSGEGEGEGERGSSAEDGAKDCGEGSSSGGDNDGKENVQNNATTTTTTKNDPAQPPPPPPPATATKSSQNRTAPTSTATTTNNEEAYWSKVSAFATSNAKKTPGTSNNIHSARRKLTDAVSGLVDYSSDLTDDEGGKWKDGVAGMTREQMRSEAEAKSQGLSSCLGLRSMFRVQPVSVLAVGEEDGKKKKKGATMKRMGQMTLLEKIDESSQLQTFSTRKHALAQLKSIVTSQQRLHRTPKTSSHKLLRKRFLDPLAKITKMKCPQHDESIIWNALRHFFQYNPVINGKLRIANNVANGAAANNDDDDDDVLMIPEDICQWMYQLACSSFEVGGHVGTECCRLIRHFVMMELDNVVVAVPNEEMEGDGGGGGGGDNDHGGGSGAQSPSSFCVDISFLKKMSMDDLVSCLEDDFGLWMGHGPMPSTADAQPGKKNADDEEEEEDAKGVVSKEKDSRSVDVYALKNVFLIWMALFHRNLIQMKEESKGDDDCSSSSAILVGQDASRVLVAFTRVGLDPHFYSANETSNTCGEPLLELLQKLMTSLVKSTTNQLSMRSDGTTMHVVEQWRKHTAHLMVEACTDLSSAKDENAADSDDIDGQLPMAMAVKRMYSSELNNNEFSVEIALMKLHFAERALHTCLKDMSDDWEDKVKERMAYLCKDWDKEENNGAVESKNASLVKERLRHAMHALVTAEVGFQYIDEESDSFMECHPRLLAAVFIAGECALVGACIFWRTQEDNNNNNHDTQLSNDDNDEQQQPAEVVYTTEEKDAVYEVISNIEDLCDGLKKECRAVIAYPHLRRTKEYLTRLAKRLGATKGKSSKYKKQRRREQGSLDSYFSRPSMSDPFRDTQDS